MLRVTLRPIAKGIITAAPGKHIYQNAGFAVGAVSFTYFKRGFQIVHAQQKLAVLGDETRAIRQLHSKPKSRSNGSHSMLLLSFITRTDWILYAISAVCSILASLMTTAQARVIGRIFDSLGQTQSMKFGLTRLFSIFLVQALLSFGGATALSVATTNLGVQLRLSFFSSILHQDMHKLDDKKTGEITHQLSQDIAMLQTAVRESFTRGVESVTSLISGSILLYMVSPSISLYLLGLLPLGSLMGTMLGESLRSLSQKSREVANRATGIANESIGNIRTVRAFASEDREVVKYGDQLKAGADLKSQMAMMSGAFYAGIGLGINLTTLLICSWGHKLVDQGLLTKGDIATIATQVQLLERSLARLSVLSASLSKAMKGSEHIFENILDQPSDKTRESFTLDKHMVRGDIQLQDVCFSYPNRKEATAVDGVSLEAKQGEVVALVGASGSGKSTIFSLVEKFYDPDSGKILLDGADIRNLDSQWLRGMIGYVSQKPDLFSGSIAENIRYGKPDATMEEIESAARRANAHEFIMSFPMGYDTMLGDSGIGLSGGQRQRIAIARSLLLDPKILLLDEITSGLDSESEYLVSKALDELMKGRTTLIIAHRLNTVKNASRVYVIEDGRVIEAGTHDELVSKRSGAYRAFWEKQNRGLKRTTSNP